MRILCPTSKVLVSHHPTQLSINHRSSPPTTITSQLTHHLLLEDSQNTSIHLASTHKTYILTSINVNMVAMNIAVIAACLQLATAAVIPREEEPPHFPSFGLRIEAPNTRFHRSFVTLTTSKKSGLKLALIPEDDRRHGIDAEFYIAKDGHLSYGQPGSQDGTFVLGFDPKQPKEHGIADAYFMPNTQATVSGVHASAGNKDVVAIHGDELKVHGKSKWLVCSINNGKGIIRNLAYDATVDSEEWKDQESAADRCTHVKVKRVDLV